MGLKHTKIVNLIKEHGHREFDPNITFSQLKSGGMVKLMSWGFRNQYTLMKRDFIFTVSGMKFQGDVLIVLDFSDTYTVFFLSSHGNVKHKMEMVYCDELTEKIDEYVEKQDYYVR